MNFKELFKHLKCKLGFHAWLTETARFSRRNRMCIHCGKLEKELYYLGSGGFYWIGGKHDTQNKKNST